MITRLGDYATDGSVLFPPSAMTPPIAPSPLALVKRAAASTILDAMKGGPSPAAVRAALAAAPVGPMDRADAPSSGPSPQAIYIGGAVVGAALLYFLSKKKRRK